MGAAVSITCPGDVRFGEVDTTHNTIANRVLLQGAKIGDVQTNTLAVQNGGTYAKKYAFPTTMPALPVFSASSAWVAATQRRSRG